jgi:hypothetical protein
MIMIVIVIGILAAAAIGTVLAIPSILKSNAANPVGHSIDNTNGGIPRLRLF